VTTNGDSLLSGRVLTFVRAHIDSVELLEVLLLLRDHAEEEWDAAGVAHELRIQPRSARSRLETLAAIDVVDLDGETARYRMGNEHAEAVDELADAYRTRRVTIITLIFDRPAQSARAFADAFVVGRKKDQES
jgi:hypothetical protein